MNDRPRDTFSGEAGDEMSVPRRKENGTAPKRVACQSPADRTAEAINLKTGKEGILPMAGEIFMRVNEVAEELGVSVPYIFLLKQMKFNMQMISATSGRKLETT